MPLCGTVTAEPVLRMERSTTVYAKSMGRMGSGRYDRVGRIRGQKDGRLLPKGSEDNHHHDGEEDSHRDDSSDKQVE